MNDRSTQKLRGARAGFTLLELLMVMLLTGILSYIGVYNLKEMASPIEDASTSTVSFLKVVRARALATTSAYTVYPVTSTRLGARTSARCDDPLGETTVDPSLQLNFPSGAQLLETAWTACFTARGLAATDQTFLIRDIAGQTRTVEVLLGGSVRIQ